MHKILELVRLEKVVVYLYSFHKMLIFSSVDLIGLNGRYQDHFDEQTKIQEFDVKQSKKRKEKKLSHIKESTNTLLIYFLNTIADRISKIICCGKSLTSWNDLWTYLGKILISRRMTRF